MFTNIISKFNLKFTQIYTIGLNFLILGNLVTSKTKINYAIWLIWLRGQSNENKYMEFLADLDSLGSKLMKKDKKWPSTYVK